ncbi:MAG TPA: hypothetical protein VHV54_21050 [Candidatus Binatia bacterium]|nr:hypothetical protein [Candidatus Binatia bacterium]
MQFVIDLIQKIPAGWPRLLTFAALVAAYFLFPDLSRKLSGGAKEKQDLDRMMQFLQMKKLLLDIEVMKKEKNLTGMEFPGEARILAELKESGVAAAKSSEKITYWSRLSYSMLGGAVFFLLAALSFAFGHFHEHSSVLESTKFLLREFGFSAACGLVASFIPLGNRRTSFLYGLTMPLVLGLLILKIER